MNPATVHRYSCIGCRTRKIKCSRVLTGCSHCEKAGVRCTYAARRPRKSFKERQEIHLHPLAPSRNFCGRMDSDRARQTSSGSSGAADDNAAEEELLAIPQELHDHSFQTRPDLQKSSSLFVAGGKTRYVNSDKAEEMRTFEDILSTRRACEGESPLGSSPQVVTRHTQDENLGHILYSMPTAGVGPRGHHPAPEQMCVLWEYYVGKVDILVKILYKPMAEKLVMRAREDLNSIDASAEALLFAIYFASLATMDAKEALRLLGQERRTLLAKFRQALEQALVQASWMTTQDITVLQALTLLIACSSERKSRIAWMISGTAISIGQAIGIHRDSSSFALGTIDTEVRRRVWWTLCLLDNRISDECGLEVHVPMGADTKYPLHVNDRDLEVEELANITPRKEYTEMAVSLSRIEKADADLRIKFSQYLNKPLETVELLRLINEKINRLETAYLSYLDISSHLHRLLHLGMRLSIAKLWKVAYGRNDEQVASERREKLLSCNAEILDVSRQLPDRTGQYGWLFACKYVEWQALVYLLFELCHQTQGPAVDHAWRIMDSVFTDGVEEQSKMRFGGVEIEQSKLWRPLQKLLTRARLARHPTASISCREVESSTTVPRTLFSPYLETRDESIYISWDSNLLFDDPFLGFTWDLETDMNWQTMDFLLQDAHS